MERIAYGTSSRRNASLVTAVGLLLMMALAAFGNFFVLERLIVAGDGAATAVEIGSSETLFRWGVMSLVIVCVLDVLVAMSLRELLLPVDRALADLAAGFRVVYAGIFLVGISFLLVALGRLDDAAFVQAQTDTFSIIWEVGLIFFGMHLLVLGALIWRSGFMPRIIGALVGLAGFAYLADSAGAVLIADYSFSFAAFLFIGEVALMGWCFYDVARTRRPRARMAMAS